MGFWQPQGAFDGLFHGVGATHEALRRVDGAVDAASGRPRPLREESATADACAEAAHPAGGAHTASGLRLRRAKGRW